MAARSRIYGILKHGENEGGDCEEVLCEFAIAGVDFEAVAIRLQDEGAKSFVKSWHELMAVIASKSSALARAS